MAAKFEITQPKPGEFRWVLTSQGRGLGKNDAYTRKGAGGNAMGSFRQVAPTADIVDTTASTVKFAPPRTTTGKAVRTTGRAVGKAAAVVAEVPSLLTSAVEKVVDVV